MKIIYRCTLGGLIGLSWFQPILAAREVSVVALSEIAFARTLTYPASVINLQQADIAAETSGQIIQFTALVGDQVNKGQVIIKLDCQSAIINKTRIEAGIKQLNAKKQLTVQQLERATRLSKTSSISREELDQRETQLQADNASIEEQQALLQAARQTVDHCEIKAPFDGMIIEKISSVGSYATPGTPQFKLLKLDAVEVRMEIPPDNINQLKQAKSIVFVNAGATYPLKIRKVLPQIDSASHQQPVLLEITSPILPAGGSFGLLKYDTEKHFITSSYVQKRAGQFGVFIARHDQAKFEILEHAEEGQSVAINLPSDTLIISNHLQLLTDNEQITISH